MISTDIVNILAARHPMGKLGIQRQSDEEESMHRALRREPFPAWSAIDDVKKTAAHEYEAASQKAQQTAGHIELYSPKYYAACTLGGLLACVSELKLAHQQYGNAQHNSFKRQLSD